MPSGTAPGTSETYTTLPPTSGLERNPRTLAVDLPDPLTGCETKRPATLSSGEVCTEVFTGLVLSEQAAADTTTAARAEGASACRVI
jgi:hypothetical protein